MTSSLLTGLEAFYTFDNTLEDSSINARTMTVTGVPTYQDGVRGTGGHCSVNERYDTPFTLVNSDISAAFWIKLTDNASNYNIIDADNGGYDFNVSYNSQITYNNSSTTVSTGVIIPLNQWTHIVVTIDATAGKVYKNGELAYTGAGGSSDSGSNYYIGNNRGNLNLYVQGYFDEVGIWSRVLTADEANTLGYGEGVSYPFDVFHDENVVGETGSAGTAAIKTNYPIEEGLTASTTKQTGRITNLIPQNSNIPSRVKVGL